MESSSYQPLTPDEDPAGSNRVDSRRRKLGTVGISGAAVLLSTASRSAMGGWGQCTGSELASGNMSRANDANPCGCSPGYWWNVNGLDTWDKHLTNYPRMTSKFNTVFGIPYFSSFDILLWQCGPSTDNTRTFLPGDGSLKNVAMHAVAALFNAAFYGARYPVPGLQNPGDVISAVKTAFAPYMLSGPTNPNDTLRGTRLKAFVSKVDVYGGSNTWCNGKDHGGV